MKKVFAFLIIVFQSTLLSAQISPNAIGYYEDALRFAMPTVSTGTARMQGLGGSNASLGDLGNISTNPASLGFFRKSDLSATLGFNFYNTSSDYLQTTTNDTKMNMTIPSIGIVIFMKPNEDDVWKGGCVGISYTRTHNFQDATHYAGDNHQTSITDKFVQDAEGTHANVFEEEAGNNGLLDLTSLSYANYVITPYNNDSTGYYSTFRDASGKLISEIEQDHQLHTKGSKGDWTFSFGGNIQDKIYLGLALGLSSISYRKERTYFERVSIDVGDGDLQQLSFVETHEMEGFGINFTLGVIAKPVDWLNIGVSASLPSRYTINEKQSIDMKAQTKNFQESAYTMLPLEYEFTVKTPFKTAIGSTFFIQKKGFFTVGAEYMGYSKMSVNGDSNPLKGDNETIKNNYDNLWIYKLGGEYRHPLFYLRAGGSYQKSPIKTEDYSTINASIGIGKRFETIYMDFAFNSMFAKSSNNPYATQRNDHSFATRKHGTHSLIMTFGTKF